ncbi:hypothetical protein NE237_007005 [Protea cynaroides]|uniref:Uncharacterized protein n=1 Tax=Protea cynaroides TaxID=273540 RepID=A0A9Q0KP62_9MAGN|nr:hypothetical protein NE237_007005 [Protea cynaroides]
MYDDAIIPRFHLASESSREKFSLDPEELKRKQEQRKAAKGAEGSKKMGGKTKAPCPKVTETPDQEVWSDGKGSGAPSLKKARTTTKFIPKDYVRFFTIPYKL